jgi:hypothetical protein
VRRGEPHKTDRGPQQQYTITTTATITGSFQLVDVTTGKVLARRPINVDHGVTYTEQGSPYVAPNLLPPDPEQVRTEGYGEVAEGFRRMIMGWTTSVEVLVYDDKKWSLKESADQLKVGDLEGAAQTLRASIEANGQAPNADPKLASKAWYNLGIALMYSQHLDEAMEALQRAQAIRSTDVAASAMADCRRMVAVREETRVKEAAAIELGATKPAAPEEPAKPGLTNADIVSMAKARLPEAVILAKIKTSNCTFDASPQALVKLKTAGVTDNVLIAITERAK